jgi:hypothetical protein
MLANLFLRKTSLKGVEPFLFYSVILFSTTLTLFPIYKLDWKLVISHFYKEDAFYYLSSAYNFTTSETLGLTGSGNSNGYHPLWMFINIMVTQIGFPKSILPNILITIEWFFVILGMLLLRRIALINGSTRSLVFVSAVAFTILLSPYTYIWLNGMESGLTLFFLILTFWKLSKPDFKLDFRLAIILALLSLSRLDFVEIVPFVVLLWLRLNWNEFGLNGKFFQVTQFGSMYFLLLAPYFLSQILLFDTILPISGKVKFFMAEATNTNGIGKFFENFKSYLLNFNDIQEAAFKNAEGLGQIGSYLIYTFFIVCLATFIFRVFQNNYLNLVAATFIIFAFTQIAIGVYMEGHLTSDPYIDWYYTALIFGILLVFWLGAPNVKNFSGKFGLNLLLSLLFILCAHIHLESLGMKHARDDISPFVLLAEGLNNLTPPGSRIASFSSGTQDYMMLNGRSMYNLDGLINSSDYFHKYLKTGRVQEYLCTNKIDYFSDSVSDIQDSSLFWMSRDGSALVLDKDKVQIIDQGPSWGNTYLTIAKVDCGNKPKPSKREIRLNRGSINRSTSFDSEEGKINQRVADSFLLLRPKDFVEKYESDSVPISAGSYRWTIRGKVAGDSSSTYLLSVSLQDLSSKMRLLLGDYTLNLDSDGSFIVNIFIDLKEEISKGRFSVGNIYNEADIGIESLVLTRIPGKLLQ